MVGISGLHLQGVPGVPRHLRKSGSFTQGPKWYNNWLVFEASLEMNSTNIKPNIKSPNLMINEYLDNDHLPLMKVANDPKQQKLCFLLKRGRGSLCRICLPKN